MGLSFNFMFIGLKIIWKYLAYTVNALWAIPLVIISRTIAPIFLIKFGDAQSGRIGHFIPDTLEEIITISKNPKSVTLWAAEVISNEEWLKMIQSYIYIKKIFKYPVRFNSLIPGCKKHTATMSINTTRDIEGKFHKNLIKPLMSQQNMRYCQGWLADLGWDGEPYVCLLARDQAYLSQLDKKNNNLIDRNYHSYRNSNIESYKKAVELLLNKGFWVFRMGSLTNRELIVNHKSFLDYSHHKNKSHLLDIYLFSNCNGLISSSTGIDGLSQAYGIPTLIVNGPSLGIANTFYNTIFVPKNLKWQNTNMTLSIRQHIENNLSRTEDFISAGIDIVDLSDDEILNATKELVLRIENKEKLDEFEQMLQSKFITTLKEWKDYASFHGFIHPNFKIGKSWIYNMKDNFD